MNRTIYVSDRAVWKRAVRFAKAHGVSVSQLICDALAFYMDRLTSR